MKPFLSKIHRTSHLVLAVVSFFILALPWAGPAFEQPDRQTESTTAVLAATTDVAPAETVQPFELPELQMTQSDLEEQVVAPLSRSASVFEFAEQDPVFDWSLPDPLEPLLDAKDQTGETERKTAPVLPVEPVMSVTVYVSANRLNLRSEPTTEAEIIAQLKFGDQVTCQAELDGWVQVLHNGQIGYLSAEFISWTMVFRSVRETVYVSASRLNLRAGPSTEDEVLSTLRRNDRLTRIGIGDGWSKVQTTAGTTGYVASEFLTKNAPVIDRSASAHNTTSQAEIDLMTKIVALEGHSRHGYEGYLAVATVIMNRVASPRYPATITRVVSQPGQFSVYTSTRKPHYSDQVRRAVMDALGGKRNLPAYVLFFATPEAYKRNVARKGVFSKLEVYQVAYGHVWCYYASDR